MTPALQRAERSLTRVIQILKVWGAKERPTLRRAEVAEVIRVAEEARQEVLAADQEAPRRTAIPAALRESVFHRDKYVCQRCRRDLTEAPELAQVDHIIPVARFGATTLDNLQTLCASCNRAKGAAA